MLLANQPILIFDYSLFNRFKLIIYKIYYKYLKLNLMNIVISMYKNKILKVVKLIK